MSTISNEDGKSMAIREFVEILEEHRKNCEMNAKYVEAQIAQKRLFELKMHESNRQQEIMRARQISEKLGVEETHMLQFKELNIAWGKKITKYDKRSLVLLEAMKEQEMMEIKEFQAKFLSKQHWPKFSPSLLNYRRIEQHLARSEDYEDAHKVKTKADKLEQAELENYEKKRQRDMFRAEENIRASKKQEVAALRKRIKAGRDELTKQRRVALERLLQRYKNIQSELDASHQLAQRSCSEGRLKMIRADGKTQNQRRQLRPRLCS